MIESHQHIACQDVVELVTDYLEHALDGADTSLFELHLNGCDGCVNHVDQMRVIVDTAGRAGEEDLPAETLDRLLTAFRDWKRS